jgi:hypothetical protein
MPGHLNIVVCHMGDAGELVNVTLSLRGKDNLDLKHGMRVHPITNCTGGFFFIWLVIDTDAYAGFFLL